MAEKNPQYGFAHRVNDWDCIVDVLDAGRGGGNVAGNGIELDVGWSTFYDAWIVAHNGFDIALPASEYLHEWLGELKKRLATGRYDESFAALWVDIKTPNAADSVAPEHRHAAGLMRVVEQVRANVPPAVAVVYDIGGRAGFGLGGGSSTGYDAIKHQLLPNEGIGAWAESGEANRIGEFYARFKADGVVRTVMHHGHALNIDEDVLVAINKPAFHAQADPFRFKKVFTWTNATVATIERYVNPANPYHTDGQIVGSPQSQWQGYFGELQDFDNAVARHAGTQRKALRTDDFWGRSGSDAAPFLNLQPSWRWCRKCGGMYFGQTSNGVCPAGGAHDPSWSGPYRMPNSSVVLAGWDSTWRWCRRCQGLFSPRSGNGVCPAGGTHDPSWSGPYSLPAATLTPPFPAQSDWFRCYKCAGMFFIKGAAPTVCPHDHRAHGWDGFSACFTPALF